MNTTLQVPIDSTLKANATKIAKAQGFSSLQEVVRIMLTKLAGGKLEVSFHVIDTDDTISPKAVTKYDSMVNTFNQGKLKTTVSHSTDELISQLSG
jgi:antitoxin component of RelBE/YafQ-DinJ toxin-antitoxin module